MIILSHPNIWVEFIKNKGKLTPSQSYRRIFNIVHNSNNVFAYNHHWNEYYLSYLSDAEDDEIDYVDVFNNIIVELNYNDKLVFENHSPLSSNQEFKNCFDLSIQIQFLLLNSQPLSDHINEDNSVLILDNIHKPNRHWIYYSILNSNNEHPPISRAVFSLN